MTLRNFYRALDVAGVSTGASLSDAQREAAYALAMTGDTACFTAGEIATDLDVSHRVAAQVLLHLGARGYGRVDLVAYCGESIVDHGDHIWSRPEHCNCGAKLTFDWRVRRGVQS